MHPAFRHQVEFQDWFFRNFFAVVDPQNKSYLSYNSKKIWTNTLKNGNNSSLTGLIKVTWRSNIICKIQLACAVRPGTLLSICRLPSSLFPCRVQLAYKKKSPLPSSQGWLPSWKRSQMRVHRQFTLDFFILFGFIRGRRITNKVNDTWARPSIFSQSRREAVTASGQIRGASHCQVILVE